MNVNHIKTAAWTLAAVLFACIIIYAAYNIIVLYREYEVAGNEYDGLSAIAHGGNPGNSNNAGEPLEPGAVEPYHCPVDFDALREINPDIVGWIVVDGTTIDYPIVQGPDNDVYLNTTFSGTSNPSGAIFMDYRNAPDFSNANTIIYGHKMRNDTMFQGLSEYKSQDFWNEHPAFIIYTPDAGYRCEVFSAYVTQPVSETYVLDFEGRANVATYLTYAIEHSLIQTGTVLYSTDRIVTLSTCDYSFDNARMVVHARLEIL